MANVQCVPDELDPTSPGYRDTETSQFRFSSSTPYKSRRRSYHECSGLRRGKFGENELEVSLLNSSEMDDLESSNLDMEPCLRTSPEKFSVFEESCRFSDSTELETVSLRPGFRPDQGLGSIHSQDMERTVPGCAGDYFSSPRVKEEFLSSYGEAKRRRCSLRLRDISDRVVPVQNQDLETSLDPVLSQTPGAGVNKPEKTSTPVLSTEEKLLLDPEITDSKPEVGDKRSEVTENSSEVQIEDDDTKDESENDDDESLDEEDEEEDDLLQQLVDNSLAVESVVVITRVVPENPVPGSEDHISQLSNSPSLFSGSIENPEIQENLEKDDDCEVPSSSPKFTLLPLGSRRVEEKVGLLGSLLHPEQDENYYLAAGHSELLPEMEEFPPLLRQSSSLDLSESTALLENYTENDADTSTENDTENDADTSAENDTENDADTSAENGTANNLSDLGSQGMSSELCRTDPSFILYSERTSSELDITTWDQIVAYSPKRAGDPED